MPTSTQLDADDRGTWVPASVPKSPPPTADEQLLVVDSKNKRRLFRLNDHPTTSIGRNPRCRVVIDDPCCSRIHCKLVAMQNEWVLVHISRTNETRVNGRPVTSICRLQDGDVICIANTQLSFWAVTPTRNVQAKEMIS